METYRDSSVTLYQHNYNDVIQCLANVSKKSDVTTLKILQTPIVDLNRNILNGFAHLIDLDLSFCSLMTFAYDVFSNLLNIKSINLSNNLLTSISIGLFRNNCNVIKLILKNNSLVTTNKIALSCLGNLEILDLSFNHISKLATECLNCYNLKTFYLNNNEIQTIINGAFNGLPKLTYLSVNCNKLKSLKNHMFSAQSSNLTHLNFSNNNISTIGDNCLIDLTELNVLNLSNNCLTSSIIKSFLFHNSKLLDLDLSGNNIFKVGRKAFDNCKHLICLSAGVFYFDISSIRDLKSLRKFQLCYTRKLIRPLRSRYWTFFDNKIQLTQIKLIFHQLEGVQLCDFSKMANLKYLHIECKNPSSVKCKINFYDHFNKMPNLHKIVLKNLNHMTVTGFLIKDNNLKHLDLTGIQNDYFNYVLHGFAVLQYLNLSFSELEDINETVFKYSVNLKHLDLANTKIKQITSTVFMNNVNLTYLDFSNCQIEIVEDFSFLNLRNLLVLDFSPCATFRSNENTFFGINKVARILI